MLLPTVNRNGTDPGELLQLQIDAMDALRDAASALDRACPNGRDFFPQGPDAVTVATNEHRDRVARLQSVLAELETLAESVADHV